MLAILTSGTGFVRHTWESAAWIDRLLIVTLGTLCIGTFAVFFKWLVSKFHVTTPSEASAVQIQGFWTRLIQVAFAVAIIVALLWPQHTRQPQITPSESVILNNLPMFRLSMLNANIFELPRAPNRIDGITGIALDVSIRNGGSPSIATEWKLYVLALGEVPMLAQLTRMSNDLRVSGNPSVVLAASESLENRTSQTPVHSGELVEGKLLFHIELPKKTILNKTTILKLSVQDIYGNEFSRDHRIGDWLTPSFLLPQRF